MIKKAWEILFGVNFYESFSNNNGISEYLERLTCTGPQKLKLGYTFFKCNLGARKIQPPPPPTHSPPHTHTGLSTVWFPVCWHKMLLATSVSVSLHHYHSIRVFAIIFVKAILQWGIQIKFFLLLSCWNIFLRHSVHSRIRMRKSHQIIIVVKWHPQSAEL